jgi:hypothetical protein
MYIEQDLRKGQIRYPENMSFTKLDYCQYLLSSQVNYKLYLDQPR